MISMWNLTSIAFSSSSTFRNNYHLNLARVIALWRLRVMLLMSFNNIGINTSWGGMYIGCWISLLQLPTDTTTTTIATAHVILCSSTMTSTTRISCISASHIEMVCLMIRVLLTSAMIFYIFNHAMMIRITTATNVLLMIAVQYCSSLLLRSIALLLLHQINTQGLWWMLTSSASTCTTSTNITTYFLQWVVMRSDVRLGNRWGRSDTLVVGG
jgi:hypothetical protein